MIATAFVLLLQEEYLPIAAGSRETYVVEDQGAESTTPATEVEARAAAPGEGGWIETKDFLGYERCWTRARDGAVEFKVDPAAEAPSLVLFRTAAKVGDRWTGALGREGLAFTFRGETFLELGTERHRALLVEFESAETARHAGHPPTRGDLWFVAGKGLVRARLTRDLDCHSHSVREYRRK
jgi:hypothetical protein